MRYYVFYDSNQWFCTYSVRHTEGSRVTLQLLDKLKGSPQRCMISSIYAMQGARPLISKYWSSTSSNKREWTFSLNTQILASL
ncbi:hypothetical protein K7X08_008523 [Anisodus acutangulus]|uniref:Uncharacterized protein n=1 Tax=Anisodus acutangulus TaxID=402998 RepID=A0A9Q1MQG9_9SOLA|nr:hypothetical protein K7X08_008523 [Anisodus acutangulus]